MNPLKLQRIGIYFASLGLLCGAAAPVSAAELQDILRRGYLVVGVKDNLRPLAFKGSEQLQGLEIDLAHHLAEALLGDSRAVVLKPLANSERLTSVLEDEVDLTIARLTATVSRARIVSFSTPYYLDGAAFLTRNPAIQDLRTLHQQPIAVLDGSDTIAAVRSLLPQSPLIGVPSYEAAKAALEAGRAVAFAADATVLVGWIQEDPQYWLLPPLLTAEPLSVAMPRGVQYDELRRRVNQAIADWQTQGKLRQQVLHWGLPEEGIPEWPPEG